MTVDRFSTRDVGESQRFEYWHNFTCRKYSTTELRQLSSEGPIDAHVSTRVLDALLLCDVTMGPRWPTRFWRGPDEIRRSPVESFSLFAIERGKVRIAQGESSIVIGPGEIALYHQDTPFTLELPTGLRAMHVSFPAPLLTSRVPEATKLTARSLSGQLSLMSAKLFRQMVSLEVPSNSAAAERLSISAIDVLSAALEWNCSPKRDANSRQVDQIKRYMIANLHDSELNVEKIAKCTATSPRTIYRFFAVESTTPMRWLWKLRLNASYRALAEGQGTRVTDVAMTHGFNDLSHFSRLFKGAFGRTPQSFKRKNYC